MFSILSALLPFAFLVQTPAPPPIPADTEIVTTASGLKYSVLAPGDGVSRPKAGDIVTMHYTGWLTDGKVFDSSITRNQPFVFTLGRGEVIKGWDEAVALMSKGQRLKLTIPAGLAYGAQARGDIPANATLIFEVQLVDFIALPAFKPGNKDAQKKTESGMTWEIVTPSSGLPPAPDDVVSLKFAMWNAQGELQQCSERDMKGGPLTDRLDSLPIPLFREGAKLLHVGERIRIEAPARVALGERLQPGMAPDEVTVWELELVNLKKPLPVPPFAMTAPEALKKTASGLGYEVLKEGTGKTPKLGKEVTVHYAGWLTDGTLFDSSFGRAEPMTFPLGRVIKGWNEGLQLMKEGAIYRFTIPYELAYGKPGAPPKIPAEATLVFHVELISVAE